MARLLLSKSTLLKERRQLAAFQRFLPSLEMKRQQLMLSVKETQQRLEAGQQAIRDIEQSIAQEIPMLADSGIDLGQLVKVNDIEYKSINIAGVSVEQVARVDISKTTISFLARPHWVDAAQQMLEQAVIQSLHNETEVQALRSLQQDLTKVTQRMNLFDKVLIPEAKANIRKIQIYLDDKDREAVVTSKIAKNKRLAATS